MRPRPIYRWKSFWFGLLTLAFMGLASWNTAREESVLTYRCFHRDYWLGRGNRVTHLATVEASPTVVPSGWEARRVIVFESGGYWKEEGVSYARVPDAAVFFPFLLGWIAFLGWRWWTHTKASESS
jgi:hypothetical protein